MSHLTASLVDDVDKKLLCVLRDGRKLIGYLRSVDQFGNLVLQDTIERIFVEHTFGDIERGVYIVRGENLVLLGEIDEEQDNTAGLTQVSVEEILEAQKRQAEQRDAEEKQKQARMLARGFQPEGVFDDLV